MQTALSTNRLALVLGLTLTWPAPSVADLVERRGAEGTLEGDVVLMDDAGVSIRTPSGATHLVAWDRVRDLRLSRPDPRRQEYLAIANELWRARTRLERGDAALAEPPLERLFARYRGQTHVTALLVAEGLLRCRLARADQIAAVIPALEVIRMRRAGVEPREATTLRPVVDPDLGLCPGVPPVWIPGRGLQKLPHDLRQYDPGGDAVVGALRDAYLASARGALGEALEPAPAGGPDHEGAQLLDAVVRCAASDAGVREPARRRLEARLSKLPAWAEAWARFAIGEALLLESDPLRRQQGLVSLAHVPARFGSTQRYLSALSLARLAAGLHGLGETAAASALRMELEQSPLGAVIAGHFPHPPASTEPETP